MAINFDVEMNQFPDNKTDAETAANIETWLDGLGITTVHELNIDHVKGFYVCIVVYE
jgi:hypothetical protein